MSGSVGRRDAEEPGRSEGVWESRRSVWGRESKSVEGLEGKEQDCFKTMQK